MIIRLISALPGPKTVRLPANSTYADIIAHLIAQGLHPHKAHNTTISIPDAHIGNNLHTLRTIPKTDYHTPMPDSPTIFLSSTKAT